LLHGDFVVDYACADARHILLQIEKLAQVGQRVQIPETVRKRLVRFVRQLGIQRFARNV
jgi:hypothetical protein